MDNLTPTDWRQVLDVVQLLNEPCTLDEFPARSLLALSKLAGAEIYGCTSSNLQGTVIPHHYTYPTVEVGVAAESFTAQPQQFLAHPVLANYIKSRDGQALAISDFLGEHEFHRQEALYAGFFQQFGLEDQMLIYLEVTAASTVGPFYQGQDFLGLSLGRDRRNFTERDRDVLNLIRPHLLQAYQNAQTLTKAQQQANQLHHIVEQIGIIILTRNGRVQTITQQAEQLLSRYTHSLSKASRQNSPTCLPGALQEWLTHCIAKWTQSSDIPSILPPFRLERDGYRLTGKLTYDAPAEQFLLLLEEVQIQTFSMEFLRLLGLTEQEARVLRLVAQDQSTEEIAQLLNTSSRTVKKHLENIYKKFGVSSRLGIVMYALDRLGVFKP